MGDVVDVDNDVEEARRVDRARVLIRTLWSPAFQHTVCVDIIRGESYMVQVVEEINRGFDSYICQRRRDLWSSEEIDSDESCFRTPTSASPVAPSDNDDMHHSQASRNTVEPRQSPLAFNTENDGVGIVKLPSGLSEDEDPEGNPSDQRVKSRMSTSSRTALCVERDGGHVGFYSRWIRWIEGCLSSASISVLVNGSPTAKFTPKRV